jgi:hypothetical protein
MTTGGQQVAWNAPIPANLKMNHQTRVALFWELPMDITAFPTHSVTQIQTQNASQTNN